MIDHETEDLIPWDSCGREIPGNPATPTVYRWGFKGVRIPGTDERVKLESLLCGNKRFTSREAITRFITALNSPREAAPPVTDARRAKQNATAREVLAEI